MTEQKHEHSINKSRSRQEIFHLLAATSTTLSQEGYIDPENTDIYIYMSYIL